MIKQQMKSAEEDNLVRDVEHIDSRKDYRNLEDEGPVEEDAPAPISLKRVTPDRVSRADRSRSRSERVCIKNNCADQSTH